MHLQALARELESNKDLTLSSALSLRRVLDSPVTLDQASMDAINSDPEYLEVEAAASRARQDCIERFGSVAAARKAKHRSNLYRDHIRAENQKNAKWNRLAELKFRAFREKAIKERAAAKPNVGCSEQTLPRLLQQESTRQMGTADSDGEESESSESFIGSRIEDVGHLTAEQTAGLVSSVHKK
jgi:hypothetical protein